ncbi:ATP-binding protein [Runella limosa]|uniref:ATP-binding protein n=1 Tax=Runella limosa TaxID=370978 RepID=UPI0006870EC7|nr:ATP-binding protein [Runella limosa]
MNFKLIVVCFIFIGYQQLFAQKAITISDSVSSVTLSQFAEVFRDPTQKMGFTEVQKQKFMPVSAPAFQYAFSKDVFWFKVQVDNQSRLDQNNWYMVWSDGLKDHVDLYVQQPDGTVQIQYGGMLTPHAQKKYQGQLPVFRLGVLPKNQVSTYYVRLQADESVVGQLTLMTHQVYIDQVSTSLAPIWMEIGIQLLRVLYNIILALYIRNTSFRWYAFHTVIVTLSVLGSMGLIGAYFSDIPWLAKVLNSGFYQLMPATYTLFMYSLLQVPRHFPKLRWVFLSVVVLSIGQVLAVFWWPRTHLLEFNNYLFLFTEALLISTTLYAIIKQIKFNRYLLIPCFITLVPFLFLNLQALGVINFSWTYPLIYFTNFIEIVALSLVLGKIIDVTEKDKIRTEKALLTEKLEAEKLQELDTLKTRFFTNISHEFRTPLTLLVGPLADLRKKFPNEDLVQVMQRNVNRLQALINQLLDLSKFDAGELKVETKKGDVSQFFSYIFGSFETLAQNKNLHFNVHQSHRSLDAQFDADKLEKITTNLLSNAFKFTPSNGRVGAEVEYIPKETTIDVILTVSDNGIGIDAQRLPRIFDRFYQVDDTSHRNYEGTGIGLALVKELVEILKGRISVKSEVNKGTTFRVEFALMASPADMTAAEATFEISHTDTSISLLLTEAAQEQNLVPADDQPVLLIVEDNPDLRLYLRKIFETQYQIIEANDGQQGLEIALQNVPDMVITDLMMPRLDGFGLCERLKTDERTSHIPVVLLTAKATLTDRLEGLGLGADEYLQKPFNKDELVIRVKNLLQQRRLLREKFSLRLATLPNEPAVGNEVSQQLDNQFIQRIRAVIDAHLSESNFDVDGLCKELGISRTNLHRKLKALTGTSATEFIRKIRLQRAAQLVQQNTLTVSEIAYQVGFESLSYFSKSFQEEFGMSPSEYGRTVE